MDARQIGVSLATVLDRLAKDTRATALETEARMTDVAERNAALDARGMGKKAEPEGPASVGGSSRVKQEGVDLFGPGAPGRLRRHGGKSMRAGKTPMNLSLVVNNG